MHDPAFCISKPVQFSLKSYIVNYIATYVNTVNLHSYSSAYIFSINDMYLYSYLCYSFPACVTSSGMAATSMIIQTLKSGDHIVTMDDLYGGEWLRMSKHYNYL